ncbi:hypothetical protein NMY22_g1394 [Coprinellus aureogranulatus]|nr:hypothetical protein NMY22_g1394 [Coprinellus aureogranulatus]
MPKDLLTIAPREANDEGEGASEGRSCLACRYSRSYSYSGDGPSISSEEIAKAVTKLDEEYGPISHLFYVISVPNHQENDKPFDLDHTVEDMINVNLSGTIAVTPTMYERMRDRGIGKICIVGSSVGVYGPANMIRYAPSKAFLNTLYASLLTLASASNVEVRRYDSDFASAEDMAVTIERAAEKGRASLVA